MQSASLSLIRCAAKFISLLLLTLVALPAVATAKLRFTFQGTATSNALGYTVGQPVTFTYTLGDFSPPTPSGTASPGVSYVWSEELLSQPEIWNSVSGTGLVGTWTRPNASFGAPYSSLEAFGDNSLKLHASADTGTTGLTVNGTGVRAVVIYATFNGLAFPGLTGSLPNPTAYFVTKLGTYTAASTWTARVWNTSNAFATFSIQSLQISAVPETQYFAADFSSTTLDPRLTVSQWNSSGQFVPGTLGNWSVASGGGALGISLAPGSNPYINDGPHVQTRRSLVKFLGDFAATITLDASAGDGTVTSFFIDTSAGAFFGTALFGNGGLNISSSFPASGNAATGQTALTVQLIRLGSTVTVQYKPVGAPAYTLLGTYSHPSLAGEAWFDLTSYAYAGPAWPSTLTSRFRDFSVVALSAPVVTVPAAITAEATGPAGASVTYSASATDQIDGPLPVNYSAAPGSVFPLGTSSVIVTAVNSGGVSATGSFTVTVQDTTAPDIAAPAAQVLEAADANGAVATFSASASDLVDGAVSVSASPSSGAIFPLGTTAVSLSASDSHGNTASTTFTVTVRDTTAPTLTLPANIIVEAISAAGTAVNFAATATDAVSSPTLVYSIAPGTTFAPGTTTVAVTATDAAGNGTTGSFTVTVRDTTAPTISSLTATPDTLWSPSHKLVPVTLSASVADAADPHPAARIVSVTCNEPAAGDWQITGDLTLLLRATRLGGGSGRVYTITVEVRDAAGNASLATTQVRVPHDRSR